MSDVLSPKTTIAQFENFGELVDAVCLLCADHTIKETIVEDIDLLWPHNALSFPSQANPHVAALLTRFDIPHTLEVFEPNAA